MLLGASFVAPKVLFKRKKKEWTLKKFDYSNKTGICKGTIIGGPIKFNPDGYGIMPLRTYQIEKNKRRSEALKKIALMK